MGNLIKRKRKTVMYGTRSKNYNVVFLQALCLLRRLKSFAVDGLAVCTIVWVPE